MRWLDGLHDCADVSSLLKVMVVTPVETSDEAEQPEGREGSEVTVLLMMRLALRPTSIAALKHEEAFGYGCKRIRSVCPVPGRRGEEVRRERGGVRRGEEGDEGRGRGGERGGEGREVERAYRCHRRWW